MPQGNQFRIKRERDLYVIEPIRPDSRHPAVTITSESNLPDFQKIGRFLQSRESYDAETLDEFARKLIGKPDEE